MSSTLQTLDAESLRSDIPDFRAGDTLKVHVRVIEGSRSRVQVFQGVVIRRQGGGLRETFTVRKVSFGVGVERTFPVHTPVIDKIEVVTRGDVRRAKLYYLRDRIGKRARVRERRSAGPEVAVERELLYADETTEALDVNGTTAQDAVAADGAVEPLSETALADGSAETPAATADEQPAAPAPDEGSAAADA